jgi:hypothetical protein
MKKIVFLNLFVLLSPLAFAQDVIVKVSGEELPAKVEEITLQEILYKHPDSLQGPTLRLAKANVFMIRFANGTREVFANNLPEQQTQQDLALSPDQMYLKGQKDARQYYKGNGPLWGSAGLVLAAPITWGASLAGPLVIGAVSPKASKLLLLEKNDLNDPNYVRGFEKQAHKRKIGRAAAGVGIGVGVGAVAVLALFAASGGIWY